MKTVLVISDTHGSRKGIDDMRALIAENDYLIHLGDGALDVRAEFSAYPNKVYFCAGNCDYLSVLPTEGELQVEQVKILYCHGHTHVAKIDVIDGITLVNPGSARQPKGAGGGYAYVVIHKDKITPVLVGESVL
ncbi:MAG: metallophosphoesterase family protein [Clostridia bacterium]|nr:metallophosphoesterase family protein [Clostridia bacterium]